MRRYTDEERQNTSKADLFDFVRKFHLSDFYYLDSGMLICKEHLEICINEGESRFFNHSTRRKESGVTLLHEYLNYSIPSAVITLSNFYLEEKMYTTTMEKLFDYYGFSTGTVQLLMDKGLMCLDGVFDDAVFCKNGREYYRLSEEENRNAGETVLCDAVCDGYWSFCEGDGRPDRTFICKNVIDAISLYEIHKKSFCHTSSWQYVPAQGYDFLELLETVRWETKDVVVDQSFQDIYPKKIEKVIYPVKGNYNQVLQQELPMWTEQERYLFIPEKIGRS